MMVVAQSFYKSGHLHYLIRRLVQLYDVYKCTHGPGHTLLRTQSRIRVNSKAWMTGACRSISTDQEACCSSAPAIRNLGGLDLHYPSLLPFFASIHSQNDRGHGYSTTFGVVLLQDQAIAELVKYLDLISTYLGPANILEANKAGDISPNETIFTIPIVVLGCSHLPRYKPLVFGPARSSAGEQSSNAFRGVR